ENGAQRGIETRQRPVFRQRLVDHRIELQLFINDPRDDCTEPLRIGIEILRTVHFLAEAESFVFGNHFQDARPGYIHLVERLHGGKTGDAALVGHARGIGSRAASGRRTHNDQTPNFLRRSIMVSAVRAAKPPLSLSSRRARTHACSSFSTVRMPLPMAMLSSTERSVSARQDSLATISK